MIRAHRLGQYKSGQNRPIIVKFREFSDKQKILFNAKTLKGMLPLAISEDFSANTNKDRAYLRACLKAAKGQLGDDVVTAASIRYKTIHIKDNGNKNHMFSLSYVNKYPGTWWKMVGSPTSS